MGRRLKYALLHSIGPPLTTGMLRLLGRTLTIEYRNEERFLELVRQGARLIPSFWHEDIPTVALAASYMLGRGIAPSATLTSRSNDGEYVARCAHRFGLETVRGSTSRGSRQALKAIEQYLQTRGHFGLAVDGPRGPRRQSKLGVAIAARNTGALIAPFTVEYSKAWRLRSWDRAAIPKPFSKCLCTFHEPFAVARDAGREELQAACARLDEALLQGRQKK